MQQQDGGPRLQWLWIGLAIMFILIGAGVFIGMVFGPSAAVTSGTVMMRFPFGFGWIWGIVGILFFVWIISWMFSWAWGPSRRHYRRRYWYGDEAYEILRARYARGEITKEQFEQMSRDLEQRG